MEPKPLQQIDRTYVRHGAGKLSYFAGCDYFRLSSHPKIQQAMIDGWRKFGGNVAASRLTTGNHVLYERVEAALRDFFKAPAALVVSNGYATNLIVAQALAREFNHTLIDSRAHVSLRDASQFLRCSVEEFPHGDVKAVAAAVKAAGTRSKIVLLTDGMFSNDGEVAPLEKYLRVLPRNGIVLLDDAHGAGLLGRNGRGTVELAGVSRERVIQTMTLSKAFGVYGGGILCSQEMRGKIVERSGMFAGSTPPPLPLMNAALEALKLLRGECKARKRLNEIVTEVKQRLRRAGYAIPATPAPLLAVVPRDAQEAAVMRKALLKRKVFPSFIKYPGSPKDGYFRFALSSEHTRGQLEDLMAALEECRG